MTETNATVDYMAEIAKLQRRDRELQKIADDQRNATMTHTTSGPGIPMPAPWRKVGRFALEAGGDIAGTVGGGMLGAITPVPGGAAIGAYSGGAIGAAGGSYASELFDPSESPNLSAARAAGESVIGGVVGDVAGLGLKWAGKPKAMKPGASDAIADVQAESARRGVKPPKMVPASLTDSRIVDMVETIGGEALMGGGAVKRAKAEMTKAGQDVVEAFGRSFKVANEPGGVIKAAIEGDKAFAEKARAAAWEQLQPHTEDLKVNIQSLKQWAVDFLAKEKGRKNRALSVLRSIAADPRNEMSWQELKNIREQFGALSKPNPSDPYSSLTKGSAEQVYKNISRELEHGLAGSKDARDLYLVASGMTRDIGERSRQAIVKTALKQETPEKIYESMVVNGRPSTVNKVFSFLSPEGKEAVQGAFIEDALRRSLSEDGVVSGKSLSNYLSRMGDKKLQALFPDAGPKSAERFKRVARTLELLEGKPDSSAFGFAARLGQYGAMVSIPIRGATPDTAAIILGPAAFAKLISSEKGFRMFTKGLQIPADAVAAAPLVSRFTAHLADLGVQFTIARKPQGEKIDMAKYQL